MRVAVLGGGVVGLSIAWALSRDHTVTVLDPQPGCGASFAAAGMLAPAGEAWFGEDDLLRAGLDSLDRWPGFAADVAAASGIDPWLSREGTLLVGATADDAADVDRVVALLETYAVPTRRLARREARAAEPALAPGLRRTVEVPGDLSVHNRRLIEALVAACATRAVRTVGAAADLDIDAGRAVGVRLRTDSSRVAADLVVVAAGCGLAGVGGVPGEIRDAVRPVKGQILRLRSSYPLVARTVRARVDGFPVYIVPRRDGEIVLGATTEEQGYDERVTVDGVHDLLRAGIAVVPGLRECALTETVARLRPGTPDNAPLVGPTSTEGLVVAGGHYRGGVLLAPLTAAAVQAYVDDADPPAAARPLHPARLEGAVR